MSWQYCASPAKSAVCRADFPEYAGRRDNRAPFAGLGGECSGTSPQEFHCRAFPCMRRCFPWNCAGNSRLQSRSLWNQMQILRPSCRGSRCRAPTGGQSPWHSPSPPQSLHVCQGVSPSCGTTQCRGLFPSVRSRLSPLRMEWSSIRQSRGNGQCGQRHTSGSSTRAV